MVNVLDILTQERKEVGLDELIFLKEKSKDYILSIPHSGTLIPVEFEKRLNIGKHFLLGTDLYTDQVYNTGGGIVITSRLNSYFVNTNKFRRINPDKSIPLYLQWGALNRKSITDAAIFKAEYSQKELEKILQFYDKYHGFIENAIQEMKNKHGYALMIECHSMNSVGQKNARDSGQERPDFSVGTLEETSANPRLISSFYDTLETEAKKHNFSITPGVPYWGGAITKKYGLPYEDVHVIQLEIKKANYMEECLYDDSTDFKINPEGLRRINLMVSKAVEAAAEEAKRLYKYSIFN